MAASSSTLKVVCCCCSCFLAVYYFRLKVEIDFRLKVTRAELEEMCADMFDRIGDPVKQALEAADMTMVRKTVMMMMMKIMRRRMVMMMMMMMMLLV